MQHNHTSVRTRGLQGVALNSYGYDYDYERPTASAARREEPKKPGPGEARRGEPRAHDQHRGRLLSAGRRLGLSVRRGTACYLGARAGGGSLRRAFPRAGHAFEPSRSRARTGQSKGTLQSEARGAGGADLPRRLHVPPHQPISQLCPACFICKISGRPKMGWVHRCGLPGQRHAVCRTNISGYAQRARTDVPLDREVSRHDKRLARWTKDVARWTK
jgi:hypothetical protein